VNDEKLVSVDPVKEAVVKMLKRLDPEDFFCPDMKGLDAITTTETCELKARGRGCSEIMTCQAYNIKKEKENNGGK
jgi:hypothetical protein